MSAESVPEYGHTVRLRVRATVRLLDRDWCEVAVQLRPSGDRPWLDLSALPLLVARRYSGCDHSREARELYSITALRRVLGAGGATVRALEGQEARVGDGSVEYQYWAALVAPFSVGLVTDPGGSVRVLALG